jgi:hypothetical protein
MVPAAYQSAAFTRARGVTAAHCLRAVRDAVALVSAAQAQDPAGVRVLVTTTPDPARTLAAVSALLGPLLASCGLDRTAVLQAAATGALGITSETLDSLTGPDAPLTVTGGGAYG